MYNCSRCGVVIVASTYQCNGTNETPSIESIFEPLLATLNLLFITFYRYLIHSVVQKQHLNYSGSATYSSCFQQSYKYSCVNVNVVATYKYNAFTFIFAFDFTFTEFRFNFITCFNDELRKKLLSQPPNINLSKHVIFKTILRKP